ncbi:Nuclear factor related to kappa-B-binding protein [Schistosoma japonicum]|nr:Nuclear factor related to kappa-B-binding protein [Schistosoma japonicum]
MISIHLKHQRSITKISSNMEENRKELHRLLEVAKSQRNSNNVVSKKLKGSVLRKGRSIGSQGCTKNPRRVPPLNAKSDAVPVNHWPGSENGFFCLLRGFLTHGGERRRLTTAQICEYVREWQICNQSRLRKLGRVYSWIDRVEDWSSVTPYALDFLTAENLPECVNRLTSRRLVCPRPFVDSKPRIHQWCWLLYPPAGTNPEVDHEWIRKFEIETTELASLFSDWFRAPRGLGGLADAVLSISGSSILSGKSKVKLSKSTNSSLRERQCSHGSDNNSDVEDSELDENERCLFIDDCQVESDDDYDDDKDSGDRQKNRKKVSSKPPHQSPSHEDSQHYSDDSIPPPLYPTRWKLRPFTNEEKTDFQLQEAERFSHPWSPFVYHIQNYCAVVGPLRSAPSALNHDLITNNSGRNWSGHSKARDHPLLRLDRPMFVSLAEIVRDAVACLPNGEGTRGDITTLVQNSGFLLPNINPRQLQQCVSSALDRLQGETSDPSVYFNNHRRIWIYRHRYRTVDEFAELHEARCAVNETKKIIQRGGNTPVLNVNKTIKPPNQFIPDKYSEYLGQQNNSRQNSSRFSGRDHHSHHTGRHNYISRDYGYMELSGKYALNDDDHIPDIEELEAADEANMIEYSCTSASCSVNSIDVEDRNATTAFDSNDDNIGNDIEIHKVNYENEILSDWDDDNHQSNNNNKRHMYLDPFHSRSPTSFILPSNNHSHSITNYKQLQSKHPNYSSNIKQRCHENSITVDDDDNVEIADYIIPNEEMNDDYF